MSIFLSLLLYRLVLRAAAHRLAKTEWQVTQKYIFGIHVETMHTRETRKCYTFMTKISDTYLFVQYIRVFKRCRIGNDFVSGRFTFPHIPPVGLNRMI